LLIAVDQLGNTLFGGEPDETISSRIGRGIVGASGNILSRIPWPKWIRDHFTGAVGQ
jgi:hypothetical protein